MAKNTKPQKKKSNWLTRLFSRFSQEDRQEMYSGFHYVGRMKPLSKGHYTRAEIQARIAA